MRCSIVHFLFYFVINHPIIRVLADLPTLLHQPTFSKHLQVHVNNTLTLTLQSIITLIRVINCSATYNQQNVLKDPSK